MNVFDEMTEIIMSYVDKKVNRLEASGEIITNKSEKSILEKLLLINREVAIVMAFDMLLAGVDTVIFIELKKEKMQINNNCI